METVLKLCKILWNEHDCLLNAHGRKQKQVYKDFIWFYYIALFPLYNTVSLWDLEI